MTKNELIKDMKFRKKCHDYGLDWNNFTIYQNVIILNSPKKDIFVLLDEHYNIIGIPKIKYYSPARTIKDYVISYKDLYDYVDMEDGIVFPYPFQDFSLKQIVELSNRISVYETNNGHSSNIIINGEIVNDEYDSVYVSLLLYINFLGEQIEEYFKNLYHMKMMGFEYPDIYTYIRRVMNNIDECIDLNIEEGNRPFPIDIVKYLGKDRKNIEDYVHELYGIIDLLLKEKGLNIKSGIEHYKELEDTEKDTPDLSTSAIKLLKILEVSEEEVNSRYEESSKTFIIKRINLESWLSETYDKGVSPVLKKPNNSSK